MAVTTGLRQGELLAIRWADVDLDAGMLRVSRQLGRDGTYSAPKTIRGRRSVDLMPVTVATLREHRMRHIEARLLAGSDWEDHDLVFCTGQGKPLGHRNVHREWKLLLAVLELPDVPFHAARHTYATHALASGSPVGDVSRQLGHSTTSMTLDTYGHVIPDAGRGVAARLSALYA